MISDEDLLLYHYRELEAADRVRIGAALAEQPELAQRLHALVARLDAAAAIPDVAVPPDAQQRWHAAIERAERGSADVAQPRTWRVTSIRWALAAAAAVLVVQAVTFQSDKRSEPSHVVAGARSAPTPEADANAYEHGLKWHLASTERRLANLGDASPEERAQLVEAIIGQNRMYALAAERAGEPQLARVLRAFTPVLEDVAKGGGQAAASSLAQLHFELRVMQARLGADAGVPPTTL